MILQAKQRLAASKLEQAVDFMHDLISNEDYEFPDALAKACLKFKCKADELRDVYDEKQFGIESALTEKQKAIDFNKNGKVDGDDLKKLREGKKPLEAAGKPLWAKDVLKHFRIQKIHHSTDGNKLVFFTDSTSYHMGIGLTKLGATLKQHELNLTLDPENARSILVTVEPLSDEIKQIMK